MNRDLPSAAMGLLRGKTRVSCHRWLRNSLEPSGRLHHASVGILWMICRSVCSELLDSLSTFFRSSPQSSSRGMAPFSRPGRWA